MEHPLELNQKQKHDQDAEAHGEANSQPTVSTQDAQQTVPKDIHQLLARSATDTVDPALTDPVDAAVGERNASELVGESGEKIHPHPFENCHAKLAADSPLKKMLDKVLRFLTQEPVASNLVTGAAIFLVCVLPWLVCGGRHKLNGTFPLLWFLYVTCKVGARLAAEVKLPEDLGMLVAGCIFCFVQTGLTYEHYFQGERLRTAALGILLLKAGLSVNLAAWRPISRTAKYLAVLPCLFEAVACTAVMSYLCHRITPDYLFLGLFICCLSPTIVLPRGRRAPTLARDASRIDDILAISAFVVTLTYFERARIGDGPLHGIAQVLLELLGGVVYGVGIGAALWVFPTKDSKDLQTQRLLLLLGFGQLALFGSQAINMDGAGVLGCITLACTAAIRWRQEGSNSTPPCTEIPVETSLRTMWQLFQPFFVGTIGYTIALHQSPMSYEFLGYGMIVVFTGLALRMGASYLCLFGADLNRKEKICVAMARLRKATVQAAILGIATEASGERLRSYSDVTAIFLTMAVASIFITAPLNFAIARMAPATPTANASRASNSHCEVTELVAGLQKSQPESQNDVKFSLKTDAQPA